MAERVDVAALRRRRTTPYGDVIISAEERDAILAALQRVERVEKALHELVKRASDPTLSEGAFGAWHLLAAALAEAEEALEGRDG